MSDDNNKIDPHFKIRNSPLQGDEAYHSPFYRRLLSAGYKGYLQGSIGGATLFAGLGALAGGILALGATALSATSIVAISSGTAFLAIPIMAGAGLIYGKDTFGHIGAYAAISAEQAELSEKRRNLLDRYYETPSKEEAKEIEKALMSQADEKSPKKWFHWKTGLMGALLVGGIALAVASGPSILGAEAGGVLTEVMSAIGIEGITSATQALVVASIGALVGAFAGIDRTYIRKWFDIQELWHEDRVTDEHKKEHNLSIDRLSKAFAHEGFVTETRDKFTALKTTDNNKVEPISTRALAPINNEPAAQSKNDSPTHHVEQVMHEKMLQSETKYLAQL